MSDAERPPIRRLADAELHPTADIHMSYLYPWDGVVDTPFGSGWAVVGPGETSRRHMHHEGETWFLTEGRGVLTVDDESRDVGPGDVIYLPPFSKHELHNPSDADRVVFLTVWWQDMALAESAAEVDESLARPARVIVNVAPPTPNGDLHLGHLSGPYLGADVYTRYLRMCGVDARYVMGTDDYQSYVQGKALETGKPAAEVADHYAAKIEETLALAGIQVDHLTRPLHAEGYAASIQAVFRALVDAGHIVEKEDEVLVSAEDGRVLFEYYVGGDCPHCGAGAGGGGCEECGRPNRHVDLGDPQATGQAAAPLRKTIRRFVVPLAPHAETLRGLVADATMPVHLRVLAEQLLAEGLPDVPASWPHEWGIPCPVPGFEDQVISAWVELGHGFLEGVRRHATSYGWPSSPDTLTPQGDVEIVHFFGFDNGFVYTLLYPLLYRLVDPDFDLASTFVCNEFFLLDGQKFSTSRGHAVWVRDLVAAAPADLVRFHVCHLRPETLRTTFTRAGFDKFVARETAAVWGWIAGTRQALLDPFDGVAQEPGFWTTSHQAHFAYLAEISHTVRAAYTADRFSTKAVTRALLELVRRGYEFASEERHWAKAPDRRNELRTANALSLLSMRVFAQLAAPIVPVFAGRLWAALGLGDDIFASGFDAELTFVPAGTRIDVTSVDFG